MLSDRFVLTCEDLSLNALLTSQQKNVHGTSIEVKNTAGQRVQELYSVNTYNQVTEYKDPRKVTIILG